MLRTLSLCCCLGFAALALAQPAYVTKKTVDGKAKKYFEKGIENMRSAQYQDALKDFESAIRVEPTFIDAHIMWAGVQYELENLSLAEAGFKKAIAIDSTYDPKALFTLAIALWKQDKYAESATCFQRFLNSRSQNTEMRTRADHFLANALFAAEAVKHPVPFEPKSLGDKINTDNPEYLPSVTADDSTLVFTRRVRGQEDFYISHKANGEWQEGKPMDDINTPENEGAQCISADGKTLVFTACNRQDGQGSCDIYLSEWKNGAWTKPVNMGPPVNTKSWESQPSLSADGKALYFASNRAGGRNDIWVSFRRPDNSWSEPRIAGDSITTKNDDMAPYIHPDGQTLYFMSNGLPGMGGFDLYYSRLQPDGRWGKPVNLGYPINTRADEGALVVSLNGKLAYYASDKQKQAAKSGIYLEKQRDRNDPDLYYFELYPEARPLPVTYVKARVTDAANGQRLPAKVEFTDLRSGSAYASSLTGSDGEFLVCLPGGKDYGLAVSKEKYLFYSENLNLEQRENNLDKPFLLDIQLVAVPDKPAGNPGTPITASKPVVLRNIFFETGSARLKTESKTELNRLKQLLEDNPGLQIQINGHTDNVGSDNDNLSLSTNRAKAVYDFLVQNGIAAARLRFKGFGETRPVDTNDTPEGRQRNRRTEFEVLNP